MPGFPAPLVRWKETDNNGLPLNGGKLWTYQAGTSTPLATYSDPDLATGHQNTNPVILDSSGRSPIFVQDGLAYKYVLTDTLGNTIWTQDNVMVPSGGQIVQQPPDGGGGGGTTIIQGVPTGSIVAYSGSTAPQTPTPGTPPYDWLVCDGSGVSRSTYKNLFLVCSTNYGAGNGSTTFNVPDFREKFLLGSAASGNNAGLNKHGGAIQHTHSGPSHAHTINPHQHNFPHNHSVPRTGWGGIIISGGGSGNGTIFGILQAGNMAYSNESNVTAATNDAQVTGAAVSGTGQGTQTDAVTLSTNTEGTEDTGPADPPYVTVYWLIKT